MNILKFHQGLIDNYKSYIRSFINIKDPRINEFVNQEIQNKKLWPEPLIQFNPTYESGKELARLIHDENLHPALDHIFKDYTLYKHQEEAIILGCQDREFIVTSGTGSGKSLTYIGTIFNHILKSGDSSIDKVQAVVVYPMNALINSQNEEIKKYELNYLKELLPPGRTIDENEKDLDEQIAELKGIVGDKFPIRYAQYTGQEDEEIRKKLRANPPHILLTNYMMLELIMTRGGKDIQIRENILDNIRFLVFDELHTYKGRQGSDVALLIRRLKAGAANKVNCIGTSATMISSTTASIYEQKEKVADIGSMIFGSAISPEQIINESLIRSIGKHITISEEGVASAIEDEIDEHNNAESFENNQVANWIEEFVALEKREGIYIRRKPFTLTDIASQLAGYSGKSLDRCQGYLQDLLTWANTLNTSPELKNRRKIFLPYRIHQFIAQTGSVYATLGDQGSRKLVLDAGLYSDDKNTFIFPLVFSRSSGHEMYSVNLNYREEKITPREFYNTVDEDEDDEIKTDSGYLLIDHKEDDEPLWDMDRDQNELPDSWFNPPRRDGSRSLRSKYKSRIPRKISFNETGEFSFETHMNFTGWFIPMPLLIDPTSGILYDARTSEWTKLIKIGGEGRSTATTVLAFETINHLREHGETPEKQKLLSFTDNRQDASLQAGHFNDFIKIGQLRAAIAKALSLYNDLDYTNIAEKVFECINLPQEQYAKKASKFPGPKKENEDVFKDLITYRLLHDLRRSWRVVLPNLEQCALLVIKYKYLDESVVDDTLWEDSELLKLMSSEERKEFLVQIFDFLRKSYALQFSMLEPSVITQNTIRIKEKLKSPWTIDDSDKIENPSHIRIEKLDRTAYNLYTDSGGYQSVLGRYIKNTALRFGIDLKGKETYNAFVYDTLSLLEEAGWLHSKPARSGAGENVKIFQLKVDNIIWSKGDEKGIIPDLVRNRSYRQLDSKVNEYFKRFYQIDFNSVKPLEGSEHTGQIGSQKRKDREKEFREGKISSLFCSPTMELGIDISDLSIVHLRNVPPSPANYAQRSGRAGRSGQAALVMAYCSNFSPHDRHYFKQPEKMVAGVVTPPRMDLVNEELLLSHLNASVLSTCSIAGLNSSIGEIIDTDNLTDLPLKESVKEAITLTNVQKTEILKYYIMVLEDSYLQEELKRRKPIWFNEDWMMRGIDEFQNSLNLALNRWRLLYRNAINQFRTANNIIENRIYADNHDKIKEAKYSRKQAERQQELLLNHDLSSKSGQSEFYPFRYLAAEGFLPGYNFTRLPIRSFMENREGSGDFISRPRFVALSEFGPRNVIYHDGSKYRVDRMVITEGAAKMEKAKISPYTGYIMMKDQFNYNVDPIVDKSLEQGMDKYIHNDFVELPETKAFELQRITCQEEERTRKGYDNRTYFTVEGGMDSVDEAIVKIGQDKLLHIHSIPAARLVHVNFKWRNSKENGYALHLKTGYWQTKKQETEEGANDDIRRIKLYTSNTSNTLFIQPVEALGLEGGKEGVITLMYALKRAIENYFQIESNEIGATIMGEEDVPNLMIYEAAEGSLGVLSQIVENPDIYKELMKHTYEFLFTEDGKELADEKLIPASYDDLLSYYNQIHHQSIDKNYIRESLKLLRDSEIEVLSSNAYSNYEEQYEALQKARDHNSSTEDQFLKYLKKYGLRLPDEAQPIIQDMFVAPDFFYKPNVMIFCDGTPHDNPVVMEDDRKKRKALNDDGRFQVLSWYYKDSLEEFVISRPDVFKKVK